MRPSVLFALVLSALALRLPAATQSVTAFFPGFAPNSLTITVGDTV